MVTTRCYDRVPEDITRPEVRLFPPQELLINRSDPASSMSADGLLSIRVEAGSVAGPVRIQYQRIEGPNPPPPTGFRFASPVYEITASWQDESAAASFDKPVSITFRIGESDLDSAEADSSRFVVQKYQRPAQPWNALATDIDVDNRSVTARVSTLSLFALTIGTNGLTVTEPVEASLTENRPSGTPSASPTPDTPPVTGTPTRVPGPTRESPEPAAPPVTPTTRPSAIPPAPTLTPGITLVPEGALHLKSGNGPTLGANGALPIQPRLPVHAALWVHCLACIEYG